MMVISMLDLWEGGGDAKLWTDQIWVFNIITTGINHKLTIFLALEENMSWSRLQSSIPEHVTDKT